MYLRSSLIFIWLLSAATLTISIVPGIYPHEYSVGEEIRAQVNSMKSFQTELPYDYYSLKFCKPKDGVHTDYDNKNLGTAMLGLKIQNSAYIFNVMERKENEFVCTKEESPKLDKYDIREFKEKIDGEYYINLILDNLPVTMFNIESDNYYVKSGFPIGFKHSDKYYINNHIIFRILVHQTNGNYVNEYKASTGLASGVGVENYKRKLNSISNDNNRKVLQKDNGNSVKIEVKNEIKNDVKNEKEIDNSKYMIVGFQAFPCSVGIGKTYRHCYNNNEDENIENKMELKPGLKIEYTYDVIWETSSIAWASRWDSYLNMSGGKVHWFSIFNSLLVVIVMAVLCFMIIVRTIRRDLTQYEDIILETSKSSDLKEEASWKLVYGDVFRAPDNSIGLIVRIGSGIQIILTFTVTVFFAAIGFLTPAHRGSLLSALIVIYLLLAITAGFSSVWLYGMITRTYDGWSNICWRVSTYFPGIAFLIFTTLNIIIKHTGSTGAVPLSTYFTILILWFVFSIPLTFLGGYYAKKLTIKEYPVRTNQIPRSIPKPTRITSPWVLYLVAGLLPFGTLFIELYFVMTSFWMGFFYYLFGYLMFIGLFTFIVTVEVAVLCTYVQLCAEDYRWWWCSYNRGGSIAFYIFLYAASFFFTTLHSLSGFVSISIYLSYMGILIWGTLMASGTIGFLSSFFFTYTLFKYVKLD